MSGPPRLSSTSIIPKSSKSRSSRKRDQKESRLPSTGTQRMSLKAPIPTSCSSDAASCCSSDASPMSSSSSSLLPKSQCDSRSFSNRKTSSVDSGDIARSSPLKRCAWATPTTDSVYAAFHDEEWGVPVHEDKKLFELLTLSGSLAEFTWPSLLSKRHMFREVFLDFEAPSVARLLEKKIVSLVTTTNFTESKIRSVIDNARQICKIKEEHGSFDKYIWSFVGYKPIVNQFKYPRQVPSKSPKAEAISKDLVKRGFRSVGPSVVYSFMQAAGLTNDHLIYCFRYLSCQLSVTTGDSSISSSLETTVI